MNRAFRLSVLGVLFCAGITVLLAQEPEVKPATASPSLLTVGLLVDNTGSIRSQLDEVIGVGKRIVESTQTGDEMFIVRFVSSDKITIPQNFTTHKWPLTQVLDNMYVEGGLSAITDAVHFAAEHLDKKGGSEGHKRALILITDGADKASSFRTEELLSLLREKKLRVYAIGFPQRQGGKVQERARKYLTSLADESGGRAYFPATRTDFENGAKSILNDIRNQ